MELFEIIIEKWNQITIKFNWIFAVVIFTLIVLLNIFLKLNYNKKRNGTLRIDGFNIGLGNTDVILKYDYKSAEIAYKIWVEMSTRKIGIMYDDNNDIIEEVYNSWHNFFTLTRDIIKEVPGSSTKDSREMIELVIQVLNDGLRPHLTRWQGRFRKWLKENKNKYEGQTPQQIQKYFPEYEELLDDLIKTNNKMINFKECLYKYVNMQ